MCIARVRALVVIGVLAILAVSTVIWAIVRDDQTDPVRRACGVPSDQVKTAIPPTRSVRVRVLNATEQSGLAVNAANKLRQAGFVVVGTGNEQETVEASAQVRYGPAGLGAAHLLRAYVRDSEPLQDNERKSDLVDLVLGEKYTATGITPSDQVQAELDRLGPPKLETEETC